MPRSTESSLGAAKAAVVERLDRDRDRVIELARELVRIASVNPRFERSDGINREADVQEVVARELQASGMTTETYEIDAGRPSLVAGWDGTPERSLILNGHVDVVPVGDRSQWTTEPFGGEIRDGRLYGRGAFDMKGGLAAAIAAARALDACGIRPLGRVEIHSVVDEEVGGFGSIDLVRRGRTASALLSVEPTDGDVVIAEGGLVWLRVTIRGRSGHAAERSASIYPHPTYEGFKPSVNAAELAARFLLAVGELEREWGRRKRPHPLLSPGINTISPGPVRVGAGLGADGLPSIMDNPAMVPDVAVLDFDLQYLPAETSAGVRRAFEAFVARWSEQDAWLRDHPPAVTWELGDLHFPPFDTPREHGLVEALVRAGEAIAGDAPVVGYPGGCDAAHYAGAGVACAGYGPTGAALHAPDEWVAVDSLVASAKVYATTIIDYCGVDS